MLELVNIHPADHDMENAVPVYIITRTGSDYNKNGIDHIRKSLAKHFNENRELNIFTGKALNDPKLLRSRLRTNPESYIVLSTKDDIIFIPKEGNEAIYNNLEEKLAEKDITSWKVIMQSCKREIY